MVFSPVFRGMEHPIGLNPNADKGEEDINASSTFGTPEPMATPDLKDVNTPPAQETAKTKDTIKETDVVESQPKRHNGLYFALGAGAVILAAMAGFGAANIQTGQGAPTPFVANGETPVIKQGGEQGSEPTAEIIDIPPFISADNDCKRVVKATVAPFSFTDSSEAKAGKATIEDLTYRVDGKKSNFVISTCGLENLPVSNTNTELNGSPVAQIDISGILPIVKPKTDNTPPVVTPETTQAKLTDIGYGQEQALCNFMTEILGCNGDVVIPQDEVERASTNYTAIAASLALKKCGPEAFAASLKSLATAANSPEFAQIALTTAGMNESDYVNNGTAAIAEASVVGVDELNQKSPEALPEINCKVTSE